MESTLNTAPSAFWVFAEEPEPVLTPFQLEQRVLTNDINSLFQKFETSMSQEFTTPEKQKKKRVKKQSSSDSKGETPEERSRRKEKKRLKKERLYSLSRSNSSVNLSFISLNPADWAGVESKSPKKHKESRLSLSTESIPGELHEGDQAKGTKKKKKKKDKNDPVEPDEEYQHLRRRNKPSSTVFVPPDIAEEEENGSSPDVGSSLDRVSADVVVDTKGAKESKENDAPEGDEDLKRFAEKHLLPRRSLWRESVAIPDDEPPVSQGGKRVVRASFSYQARQNRELSFVEGAVLRITSPERKKGSKGGAFVEAECEGRVGLVPAHVAEPKASFSSQERMSSVGPRRPFEEVLEQVPLETRRPRRSRWSFSSFFSAIFGR